jgi:hypothetical protein
MAGHVFLLGSARISHADIDYLALFPIYQLGVVLFGVALGSLPGSASALSAAGHAAIVVLGASVLTDALAPGTFSALANRGAGFAQNANIAAFILASLTAVSLDYRHYRRRDTLILAIAFVAVFFTFSRAGLAQFLLVAATYAFCMLSGDNRSAQRSMAPVRLVGLAATLAVLGLIALSLPQLVDSTAIRDVRGVGERLDQLLFREGASIVVDPYRRPLIRHYFGLVTERPFLGHGTGFALGEAMPAAPFQMGPHTMYLRVWVDHGLWGLLTYCGLLASFLALMLRSGWIGGILLAVLLLIGSGFSHTLIDNKSTLVLIGLALGVTAGGRPGRHGARGRR